MKTVSSLDLLISIRNLFEEKLQEKQETIPVYESRFPTVDRVNSFYIVKPILQRDIGNVNMLGTIEVCAYSSNLKKDADQSQPNLSELKRLTDIALSILDDAIKDATAITSIETSEPIYHPEIKSFYISIVCGTFSIKSIN